MGKWEDYLQTAIITLIFAFLLSKLISIFLSFSNQNLRLTRNYNPTLSDPEPERAGSDTESNIAQMGTDDDKDDDDDDDDDDWEGVESTELDEAFSAATSFVAATVAGGGAPNKVSQEKQLELYGLYKIASEGPCTAPQPSPLKLSARAKWQAWQKLGAMPPEEAMEKYIDIVTELYPSWLSGSSVKSRGGDKVSSSNTKGPMGPVFSSYVHEEEPGNELTMDAVHAFAREGEVDNLSKSIESGVPLNLKDSEGRTPLHWAVDRGHFDVVKLLINRNADVNAKDDEGQTPLHYAIICEREDIAGYLVKHNANPDAKDNDGSSPSDICQSNWPWIHQKTEQIS